MYPVISILRRSAANIVYVSSAGLTEDKGSRFIKLERPTSPLNLETGVWGKPVGSHQVYQLRVEGRTQEETAQRLCKAENTLANLIKAPDILFTMIMGPEEERETPTGWVRLTRVAVARGVFRLSSPRLLSPISQKERASVTFKNLPPGVVVERR
jgi:hypothetical protein